MNGLYVEVAPVRCREGSMDGGGEVSREVGNREGAWEGDVGRVTPSTSVLEKDMGGEGR